MSDDDEDARLVAFIDGELDESARAALDARLATDADLRERLARLREGGRPFASAFEPCSTTRPSSAWKPRLPSTSRAKSAAARRCAIHRTLRTGVLAAAAAVILFCAGIVIGRYGPSWLAAGPRRSTMKTGDRRSSNIQPLHSRHFRAGTRFAGKGPCLVGAKLGLSLTPERVALANLRFKGAQILIFRGRSARPNRLSRSGDGAGSLLHHPRFRAGRGDENGNPRRIRGRLLGAGRARLYVDWEIAGQADRRARQLARAAVLRSSPGEGCSHPTRKYLMSIHDTLRHRPTELAARY